MRTLTYLTIFMLAGCNHHHSWSEHNFDKSLSTLHGSRSIATHYQFAHDVEPFEQHRRQNKSEIMYDWNSCRTMSAAPRQFELTQIQLITPFPQNSDQLSVTLMNELDRLIPDLALLTLPYHLFMVGHTNSDGDLSLNTDLSKRRAENIKAYLQQNGIPSTAISAVGMADQIPLINKTKMAASQLNRRVEIFIYQPSMNLSANGSVCHDVIK